MGFMLGKAAHLRKESKPFQNEIGLSLDWVESPAGCQTLGSASMCNYDLGGKTLWMIERRDRDGIGILLYSTFFCIAPALMFVLRSIQLERAFRK